MRPRLTQHEKQFFLFDPAEVLVSYDEDIYLSAIALGPLDLNKGSLLVVKQDADGKLLYPRPCIFRFKKRAKLKERPVGAVGISYDQAQAMLATAARCCSIEIVGKYDKDQFRREYKLSQLEDGRVPFSTIDFMLACFWGRFEQEGSTWAERAEFLTRFVGEEVSGKAVEHRSTRLGLRRSR